MLHLVYIQDAHTTTGRRTKKYKNNTLSYITWHLVQCSDVKKSRDGNYIIYRHVIAENVKRFERSFIRTDKRKTYFQHPRILSPDSLYAWL